MSTRKRPGLYGSSKRAKRVLTSRLKEFEPGYDRALRNSEVKRRLGSSEWIATRVLEQFGTLCGNVRIIASSEFERIYQSGELEAWMFENIRGWSKRVQK